MGDQIIDEEVKEQHGEVPRDGNVVLIPVASCIYMYSTLVYFIDFFFKVSFFFFLYLFQAFLPISVAVTSSGNEIVKGIE